MKHLLFIISILFLFSCKKEPITPPITNDSSLIGHWEYPAQFNAEPCYTFYTNSIIDYHIVCEVQVSEMTYRTEADTLHITSPSGVKSANWYKIKGDTLVFFSPSDPQYMLKQE